jgi:WD40-like Beta Propeller Repeat
MKFFSLLAVFMVLGAVAEAQTQRAAFAYASGRTMTLADASGRPLTSLTVPQEIGDFAVESSGRHVVIETPGEYGGQLLWCSVSGKSCERLTHGPYFYKSEKDLKEVYASPSFSPDNTRIAFAIRSLYRDPDRAKEEDAWEAQGPLAVMTVQGGRVRILKSTTGKGACLTASPLWSPDASKILFACEEGGGIVYVGGAHRLDLTDTMEGPPLDTEMDMSTTQPLAWAGDNAILFTRSRSNNLEDLEKSRILQLDLCSMQAHPIKEFGGIPASDLQDAWQIQKSKRLVFVARRSGKVQVYNRQSGRVVWKAHGTPTEPVYVQLISGGWRPDGSRVAHTSRPLRCMRPFLQHKRMSQRH